MIQPLCYSPISHTQLWICSEVLKMAECLQLPYQYQILLARRRSPGAYLEAGQSQPSIEP